MDVAWPPRELHAALLVALAATSLVAWLLVRLRREPGAQLQHVTSSSWAAVARHLSRRGAAPELIALALASYELDLPGAPTVSARLPVAVATTADTLGLPLSDLQRGVVGLAGTPAGAAATIARLHPLRTALAEAPGVARVGGLWPGEPAALAGAVRAYAQLARVRGRR